MRPCPVDLNPLGPGDICPVCNHRVIAHDIDQVCSSCEVREAGGLTGWWSTGPDPPSSADPPISTR
jgi:hypothetical protein